ncbi:MAG: hypothetical protein EBR26_02450 [Microbacteriaceae bacterium]|nr:hypothetical protein [Microbacteriaceae bacterium]
MWIFTETGFISAVRKPEYPDAITVRARDRQSLEALAKKANVEIKKSPNGDYPYRVFVGDAPFIEWFLDRGGELKYDNFKNRVYQTRGPEFAKALGNVWSAMLAVEDAEARNESFSEEVEDLERGAETARKLISVTKLPEDFTELSEAEQIAWAEKLAEQIRDRALQSEAEPKFWSDEDKQG